jgi:hypothetical protein
MNRTLSAGTATAAFAAGALARESEVAGAMLTSPIRDQGNNVLSRERFRARRVWVSTRVNQDI